MKERIKRTLKAELDPLLKRIEQHKATIASERDLLRAVVEEVNDIVESLDEGEECLQTGLRELQDGLDRMSEYV